MTLLSRICPEYKYAVHEFKYSQFKDRYPELAEACNVFEYSKGTIKGLESELDLLEDDGKFYDIREVLVELTRLFSEAGESEPAMFTMRWAKDNGYSSQQSSLRL